MKKIITWLLVIVLTAGAAIGGTLAYLTDRDSEANVFTVGNVSIDLNEEFEQGSELIPGVDIKKEATITNTGNNDVWVWLTVLLPEEMGPYTAPDNMSASNNVVHWNYPAESAANITVDFNSTPVEIDTDGDGNAESYYQTNMLWKNVLEAGDTTGIMLSKVYMDKHVDIDPDGNMHWVVDGVATDLNWNVNEKGNPVIHVSAYGIQTEGFETVEAAYAAYQTQWGENGTEYAETGNIAYTVEELHAALEAGGEVILGTDIEITPDTELPRGNYIAAIFKDTTLDLNGHNITFDLGADKADSSPRMFYVYYADLTIKGEGTLSVTNDAAVAWVASGGGNLYIEGGNFVSDNHLTGMPNDVFAIVYSSGGEVHVYGGTFTYGNMSGGTNGGFNVQDWWGHKITLYEGVLLSNEVYRQPQDTSALRIRLDEGCTLKEVVIDGVTWYQVVKE